MQQPLLSASADTSGMNYGLEDPNNKKFRKPYTITKGRETWTDQEHDKFIEAIHLCVAMHRSIFSRCKRMGQVSSEYVPPPRPKRKAAHPYPQKAPKNAVSQVTGPFKYSAALPEFVITQNSFSVPRNPVRSSAMSFWANNNIPPVNASHFKDDGGLSGPTEARSCRL